MAQKLTIKEIRELKSKRKIVMVSAFDYFNARAVEAAGIDVIGTAGAFINYFIRGRVFANDDTLEDALMVLEGVRNGAPNTFIFILPPFSDEFNGIDQTLKMASVLFAAGADAIRIQGATPIKLKKMEAMTEEGIPVAGHLGLMPRFTTWLGGFRCQGKKAEEAVQIYRDAKNIESAGGNWIEMECVPYKVAAEITKRVNIPIIGIGSGPYCDGEVQVHLDTLGLHDGHYPKHSKVYLSYLKDSIGALKQYKEEVESSSFPSPEYAFEITDVEFEKFLDGIDRIK